MVCVQGQRCRRRSGPGLRGPPQLPHHGPAEPLRLLPAPRRLLLAGPAGRALHPAAAREQEEAAAADAGRRRAVPAPPAGPEEEGQRAAAGHAQPGDLERRAIWRETCCEPHVIRFPPLLHTSTRCCTPASVLTRSDKDAEAEQGSKCFYFPECRAAEHDDKRFDLYVFVFRDNGGDFVQTLNG